MSRGTYSRRTIMRAGAGAAIGATALGATAAAPASAQSTFDGWMDDVDNYDGVEDLTGESEVTVDVGSEANGGNFGFGPAAIQVDPGTTVVWEWVAGSHNVVDDAGNFESELTDETGFTFTQTFDEEGVIKYACSPHEAMGMKGVVVVGDAAGAAGGGSQDGDGGGTPSFDGWMDDVDNYDGIADETGSGDVTVEVGSEANGGNFGYAPPAIQVDPGTTVTWEWVAGSHNVVDEAGNFESELTDEEGFTFSQTFDEEGVVKYACSPHEAMGMKGVVVVGDALPGGDGGGADQGGSGGGDDGLTGEDYATISVALALVAGLLSPLGFAAFLKKEEPSR